MLLVFSVLVLAVTGCLLVPVGVNAGPKGEVGYKLYHDENGSWVRYYQGDPFPPGGAEPGTNLWKYEYTVYNREFPSGIYQMLAFFNSDALTERAIYSSVMAPTGWSTTYFGPVDPWVNWKMRFLTTSSYVMPGDGLSGYEIQFTWADPAMLPGPQNYDLICSQGSEPGVTHELPPDCAEERVKDHAYNETSVYGGYLGGYPKTHASDNDYERIYEEIVGLGGNAKSRAEHKWKIDVSGNPPIEFCVEAHHTVNTENDHFDFHYSTYDGGYVKMLTVSKTSDDNRLQCYSLPDGVAGTTVWIRVVDTNFSKKNGQVDALFVDYMYIESEAGPQVPEVVYNSCAVDDGENEVLDPGETASLIVTLENVSSADAGNVAAVLSTDDSYITINDNAGTYGNILAGGTADNAADPCNVTADPGTPMGHVAEFYLHITANGGYTDADTFYLVIGQQAVHVSSIDLSYELTRTAKHNRFYVATATVTVVDADDNPVEGAWVYGQWSRQTADRDSGLTDVDGQVALKSDEAKNPGDWFSFCVTDAQKGGWMYDPGANAETCDSIRVGASAERVAGILPATLPTVVPTSFSLSQNYPNPFNPETEIEYKLPVGSEVTLEIYSAVGQRVATLVDQYQSAGTHTVAWNAGGTASGIYFCRITAGTFTQMRKLVLLK
jgi:hypothetical protein